MAAARYIFPGQAANMTRIRSTFIGIEDAAQGVKGGMGLYRKSPHLGYLTSLYFKGGSVWFILLSSTYWYEMTASFSRGRGRNKESKGKISRDHSPPSRS